MATKQRQNATTAALSWHQACAALALTVADFYARHEHEIDGETDLHARGLLNALLNDLRPQDLVAETRACVRNYAEFWERQLDELPDNGTA